MQVTSTTKPDTPLLNAVFAKVFHKETVAMTDSLKVAHYFGKRHDNLLATLKKLGCSDEFNALNFKAVKYIDEKGEKRPMYLMTYDGFTLLVMGFTGKKAMQFKEQYIKEFNEMKRWINNRANIKADQIRMNEAIQYRLEQTGKERAERMTPHSLRARASELLNDCRTLIFIERFKAQMMKRGEPLPHYRGRTYRTDLMNEERKDPLIKPSLLNTETKKRSADKTARFRTNESFIDRLERKLLKRAKRRTKGIKQ